MMPKSQSRRRLMGLAAALGGLPLFAQAGQGGRLRIVTSNLPPLAMEKGAMPGALHEMVIELSRRMELTPEVEFVPWKRAIFLASQMPATTIFPLTRLPEREAHFRWLAKLYEENYVFLAPRGGRFNVHQPEKMKNKRITMLRGSTLKKVLIEMGYPRIAEAGSIDEVHRFLVQGMADASFGERAIIRSSLRRRGAESDFELSEPVRSPAAWLAGSLDFSDAEVASFQRVMKEMTADGTCLRILKKYELD